MSDIQTRVLAKMLERLFASMLNGPGLNCRPHSSRQRVDFASLSRFRDINPTEALLALLSEKRSVRLAAKIRATRRKLDEEGLTQQERQQIQEFSAQQTLVKKLSIIADDARTYEMDTGVYVLNLGFPLLALPVNALGGGTRRILAPIAFVPVTLDVNRGATDSITIACRAGGQDLITPNSALLTWLEAQTNNAPSDLFSDDDGEDPWREISHLIQRVAKLLSLHVPEMLQFPEPPAPTTQGAPDSASAFILPPSSFALSTAPRSDDPLDSPTILPAAVLGLFPANNQSLLRDTQAMIAGEPLNGPIQSFLTPALALDTPQPTPEEAGPEESIAKGKRTFADERLVAQCDPCQARAVKLARNARGLVMHGPPGTGKSQTITNIIGDHLSRGQRVLLVCDKRTALDVVANRLAHMGLSSLCALVHDPQRDQRELYKSIREQIESLAETETDDKAEKKLAKLDTELQDVHDELSRYYSALMDASNGADSFHNMVGHWLALRDASTVAVDDPALQSVSLPDLDQHEPALRELLERGQSISYASNPWVDAAGVPLADFLSWPMAEFRNTIQRCIRESHEADATIRPNLPPFSDHPDLATQAAARVQLADDLESLIKETDPALRQAFLRKDTTSLNMAEMRLKESAKLIDSFRSTPLDNDLAAAARSQPPQLFQLNQQLAALDAYLEIATKWYGFICFKRKSEATAALKPYGLPLAPASATRLRTFLLSLRDRLHLQAIHNELNPTPTTTLLPDDSLATSLSHLRRLTAFMQRLSDPALTNLRRQVHDILPTSGDPAFLESLRHSPPRAQALTELDEALAAAKLFDPAWLASFNASQRQHHPAAPTITDLAARIDTLENALRIRQSLPALPASIRNAALVLLRASAAPDESINTLRRSALTAAIAQRLRSDPHLQSMDAQRLKSAFDRYRKLDAQKRDRVRDTVLHQWVSKQKDRLLAATGGRLNSLGADTKRRLTLRGERAMRLRQVVSLGATQEGGDPLFDLRPIWMASPETVAQIFPRKPVFDVIVFDEASQCRLEEALPVLTRAARVVIAGDPKQLPPTRFFESTVAATDDEGEVETDQDLFELQQGEVEDLLAAALNLEIDQCYLDVHYRSKNADLIEFSNQHFYNTRLQPIPQHPARRGHVPPIRLVRADGLYQDRSNEIEADLVVSLVKELLSHKKPPSIGIACFNVTQRDLILDKLDEAAGEDATFAAQLESARARVGQGSFEGLFVKNLENVQGDERDHMIISTTYGPDEQGRFYRRFGPLGLQGGGRRLNVLVTRAREQVHLITSIPESTYQALPQLPQGQSPAGPWLLFAYLHYAHKLQSTYAADSSQLATPNSQLQHHPTRTPSPFATALAAHLNQHHDIPSTTHWGNEGFCIDVALSNPATPTTPMIGLLTDAPRFKQADDPVEWDLFRTAIHESQGWTLHRLWTPHFFRDPEGSIGQVVRATGGVA